MLVAILTISALSGATLTVGEATGAPAQTGVTLPVTLDGEVGDAVAAIQFDVLFDADSFMLGDMSVGKAAEDADKDLDYYEIAPGDVRVIIAGLNQLTIADGVVADASFDIHADALDGVYAVSLANVLVSDPYGSPVTCDGITGELNVEQSGGEGEGEGETPSGCAARLDSFPGGGQLAGAMGDLAATLSVLAALLALTRRRPGEYGGGRLHATRTSR